MKVDWDEDKRISNIEDRNVDFIVAARIFRNPVIENVDDRKEYRETRHRAIGQVDGDYYVVVYTWRGDTRRIISAWKVGEHGKRRYQKLLSR